MMTENIELAAKTAHEVNRAYCTGLGDDSQLAWEDAPDWQREGSRMGVKMIIANPDSSASACHESWLAQKVKDGWKYGLVKDAEKKEHPCLVPFDNLPDYQIAKDVLFGAAVRGVLSGTTAQ